jgi:hypothetical protein
MSFLNYRPALFEVFELGQNAQSFIGHYQSNKNVNPLMFVSSESAIQ